jgi:peroxiredoxin
LSTQPYAGAVAPDFTLTTLTDEPVTLSQLRGKPTLINFWASWCPPCRQELPALQSTYDAYGETINFLAVNVKESRGTVQSFAEKMNLTFPILLDGQGQVSDHLYQVRGIPTTLFVDARGVVVNRHVGPLDETTINAYLQPLLLPQTVANGEESQPAVETPSAEPKEQTGPPRTGDQAPDFTLPDNRGNEFKLAEELKVNAVVLVFYRGHT